MQDLAKCACAGATLPKLLLTADGGHYVGNITDAKMSPFLDGQVTGSVTEANLTVNARVEIAPAELERIVRAVLDRAADRRVRVEFHGLRCLRPGRPQPTYRYGTLVG